MFMLASADWRLVMFLVVAVLLVLFVLLLGSQMPRRRGRKHEASRKEYWGNPKKPRNTAFENL